MSRRSDATWWNPRRRVEFEWIRGTRFEQDCESPWGLLAPRPFSFLPSRGADAERNEPEDGKATLTSNSLIMDTGLICSLALLHPSSKVLGYFHYAPTGHLSAPGVPLAACCQCGTSRQQHWRTRRQWHPGEAIDKAYFQKFARYDPPRPVVLDRQTEIIWNHPHRASARFSS